MDAHAPHFLTDYESVLCTPNKSADMHVILMKILGGYCLSVLRRTSVSSIDFIKL